MRQQPPEALVDLLGRLHLATPEQVQAVAGRARRLACELPLFDGVWIDALVQARLLTPYQAAQINAGHGEQLLVGPYVIQKLIQRLGYADCFLAKKVRQNESEISSDKNEKSKGFSTLSSGKSAGVEGRQKRSSNSKRIVRLLVVRDLAASQVETAAEKLRSVSQKLIPIDQAVVDPLQAVGSTEKSLWAAYTPAVGFPAIEWLSSQGRLPPVVVMEIARQMVGALATLESVGIVHGDISASSLWFHESGAIKLNCCGMHSALRQIASERFELLPLEALDYLAPERICTTNNVLGIPTHTTLPNHESLTDIYACGCLWWHLLAGRPPLAGGDLEAKLAAIQKNSIADIRPIAPDTPAALAEAIEKCTQCDPHQRPSSFRELAEQLGPPTIAGRRRLVIELLRGGHPALRPNLSTRMQTGLRRAAQPLLAAAACVFLLAAATWPLWRPHQTTGDRLVANITNVPADGNRTIVAIAPSGDAGSHAGEEKFKNRKSPSQDRDVRQVNFQTGDEVPAKTNFLSTTLSNRPVIELAGKTEISTALLHLQPSSIVRGSPSKRSVVVVPPQGLTVAVDDVRFENIDFTWQVSRQTIIASDQPAMFNMRTAHVEFACCTFQASRTDAIQSPVAIRLVGTAQNSALAPASRVKLDRCVMIDAAAGIDCQAPGPVAIDIQNTLYLGRGPLIRFLHARPVDAPAEISLQHATVRGATSVLEFNCDDAAEGVGLINVITNDCVFAPAADGALVALSSHSSSRSISAFLKSLAWTGRGSLADSHAAILQRQLGDAREGLPDDEFSLDGLVSSGFDFAGLAGRDPATSQVRKWLAPLETDQPPGIGDDLPKPPQIKTP